MRRYEILGAGGRQMVLAELPPGYLSSTWWTVTVGGDEWHVRISSIIAWREDTDWPENSIETEIS